MELQLSDRQRTTVVSAITILAVCVILAALGALVVLLATFLREFSSVFLPLTVAAFLALVIKPYYDLFRERLGWPTAVSVGLVFLSLLVPVAAVGVFIGTIAVPQMLDLADNVPEWMESLREWFRDNAPRLFEVGERWGIGESVQATIEGNRDAVVQGLRSLGSTAMTAGAGFLRGIGTLFAWAVLPVYFAFFLIATPSVQRAHALLPFLKEETRNDVVYLVEEFVNIMVAFFRGQLIVALCQGLLFAVGFWAAGLRYGFVLGIVLGFLNIIPYLGSIVGLAVCVPLAFVQPGGGPGLVVAVLGVFAVVQLIEGYLLTPKIMGDRTGLHPMAIIVAIFFWGTALDGILGMILAIPFTAFGVVFWRLAKEKYISELV